MAQVQEGIPLIRVLPRDLIPLDQLEPGEDLLELLNRILVTRYQEEFLEADNAGHIEADLSVVPETVLAIPGLDGFGLVFGGGSASLITFGATFRETSYQFRIGGGVQLRFPREWLKPVIRDNHRWVDNPLQQYTEIGIGAAVLIDDRGSVNLDGLNEFILAPSMIADTGLVIEGTIALDFSSNQSLPESTAMGLGPEWRGVVFKTLAIYLPDDLDVPISPTDLTLTNFHIGSGGISGGISGNWNPSISGTDITGSGSGTLFSISFGLKTLQVAFLQNSLTGIDISGVLGLPFFNHALDVELGLDLAGNFSLSVGNSSGIEEFTLEAGGIQIAQVKLERLSIEHQENSITVAIGGNITPQFGGLDWPTFDIKKLSIDSEGNVKLDGGWLTLSEQYSLNFYGFQLEITQLGFGKTEDGGKWIGFSGGLKLVDGLSAGASVEGLRVTWYEDGRKPSISFNGVGVEFEVPGTLRFKGEVAYRQLTDGAETINRFDGAIKLELLTLNLTIDAILVVGTATDPVQGSYTFFAIYLGVDLPAGIPLWSTGVALYGMAGLFALQMEPDKREDEPWYGLAPNEGWYKRPEIGVTDLIRKWENERGSLAFGAGITLGTVPDNGFTFSGRLLLVIVFPGPIVLFEGKANLLKERSKLNQEPIFRALAVLDGRERSFLFGLDAQYKFADNGELIDIRGGVEAFFDFDNPLAWHLYLGEKEPRERRIRAEVLTIFEANSYFMIDAHKLAMGAWVGYDKRWKFGPLRVIVEAWIEGNTIISWNPAHFYGDLWLHGKAELSVFGFGLGLSADARIAADVFDPFHIVGAFRVGINLPWPLPDFSVGITLEWGPEPDPPLLPKPLQSVSAEHFKVTTKWPLPAGQLLLPNYDANGDGLLDGSTAENLPVSADHTSPNDSAIPIVPLDTRPHLTFGRSVHDDALISVNPQPPSPDRERIGDPDKNEGPVLIRYGLKEILLEKRNGSNWEVVARKGDTPNPASVPRLFGSWAPLPPLPLPENFDDSSDNHVNQTKLWLWSRTPYSYTRHTSDDWDDWFEDWFSSYPCIPDAPDRVVCCDFDDFPIAPVQSPLTCREHPFIIFRAINQRSFDVVSIYPSISGHRRGLCVSPDQAIDILLREPSDEVKIAARIAPALPSAPVCVDFRDSEQTQQFPNPHKENGVEFTVLDRRGRPEGALIVSSFGTVPGIIVNSQLTMKLPCPSDFVEITYTHFSSPPELTAININGEVVARARGQADNREQETLRLEGNDIVQVIFIAPNAETLVHTICFECDSSAEATWRAIGFSDNLTFPTGSTSDSTLTVRGRQMNRIRVEGTTQICLIEVCVNIGPDPEDVQRRIEMTDHMESQLTRWQDRGFVLEPHTVYRLQVVTTIAAQGEGDFSSYSRNFEIVEFAYFRTAGAPGVTTLSTPIDHPNQDEFQKAQGGLGDLMLYVDQTIPPTVPKKPNEKALLPRPVYRAYDVGVRFNEDYVDLMYRSSGRDLGLYLFDNNNQPVRDEFGGIITISNQWGVTEETSLDSKELRFVGQINRSSCLSNVDIDLTPRNRTLDASQLLEADTVYEARLIPMLLHDDFSAYTAGTIVSGGQQLGDWQVIDSGNVSAPSRWIVGASGTPATPHIEQTSNIHGGSTNRDGLLKPGTTLVRGDNSWTDYRITLFMRSADNDAIGVVFRYRDSNNFYRFSMDRERRYRRLVRVRNGTATLLAEDDFVYESDRDYRVTIEAISNNLRVYQDGEQIFVVQDDALGNGRIGLYAWASEGARFKDVLVHDFRANAPVVYRFPFTTSQFTNFFHHLHSYQDETWLVEIADETPTDELNAMLAAAIVPTINLPSEAESRAYASLAALAFGAAAYQEPQELEVSRIEHRGMPICFALRSPEPIDWSRTALTVSRADTILRPAKPPGDIKITAFEMGASQVVHLLARETVNLAGSKLEYERWSTPLDRYASDTVLFSDRFAEDNIDGWVFVDNGDRSDPSRWNIVDGLLRQTSNIHSMPLDRDALKKPGTLGLVGSPTWDDVVVQIGLQSFDNDAFGAVFRYQDNDNYYRFSMDNERSYRRLVKNVGGTMTLLWEDNLRYEIGRRYELTLVAIGGMLRGYLDGRLMFEVFDYDLLNGQIGLYCWANNNARFDRVWVIKAATQSPTNLLTDTFNFLKPDFWQFIDESARTEPSHWQANGTLVPTANTHPIANVANTGVYAVAGDLSWQDYRLKTSLSLTNPNDESVGVMFRYQDDNNYYRLTLSQQRSRFRLERKHTGTLTMLWEVNQVLEPDRLYQLTVECLGSHLSAFLDGALLFEIEDAVLTTGKVALYSGANTGVSFEEVIVEPPIWETYHTFVRDEMLPVGTQIMVGGASSNEDVLIPAENAPVLTLPARLRWNLSGHERTFINAASWVEIPNIKLLRKADGTGVFIVLPTLNPGHYRFDFTYRRDNTTFVPKSLILRQGGDSTPEKASIEFGWHTVGIVR